MERDTFKGSYGRQEIAEDRNGRFPARLVAGLSLIRTVSTPVTLTLLSPTPDHLNHCNRASVGRGNNNLLWLRLVTGALIIILEYMAPGDPDGGMFGVQCGGGLPAQVLESCRQASASMTAVSPDSDHKGITLAHGPILDPPPFNLLSSLCPKGYHARQC